MFQNPQSQPEALDKMKRQQDDTIVVVVVVVIIIITITIQWASSSLLSLLSLLSSLSLLWIGIIISIIIVSTIILNIILSITIIFCSTVINITYCYNLLYIYMIIYIYINIIIYNIVCVLDDDLHRSSSFLRDSAHVMTPPLLSFLPRGRTDRNRNAAEPRWRDGEMGRVWWFQGTQGLLWHQKWPGNRHKHHEI